MANMGNPVSTRLDGDTEQALEEYAEQRGISRSKALAELADAGLRISGDDGPDIEANSDINRLLELQEEAEQLAAQIQQKTTAQTQQVERMMADHFDLADVDREQLEAFADQPYKIVPKGESEYYIVTPRFVPFSVGHLLDQDDAWNVFVINKYVGWIEDIPEIIRDKIDLDRRYDHAVVEDGVLELDDEGERGRAWDHVGDRAAPGEIPPDDVLDDLDHHELRGLAKYYDDISGNADSGTIRDALREKRGETSKIRIKSGKEFDVIADLVDKGNLPFAAKSIADEDLRGEPAGVSLRPYQERAWEQFRQHGQVGVYWPPGLGKTIFGFYAGERIPGKKLIVVPSSTLEGQWEDRRDGNDPDFPKMVHHPHEYEVRTYQYLTTGDNMEEYTGVNAPELTLFDECHTLPANTFSKLATLDTTYRIGLSATPYREDERTDYIFALTGVPVGIQWEEVMKYTDYSFPEVVVYLYRTERQKREDLKQILKEGAGKSLVFCDGIDDGKRLSDELGVPFVHGETPKSERMDIFRDNRVVIGSRVADEGLSLDDLDRVIEFQFHGGSRRQELQRAGRVMHSDGVGQHIVQMTDDEYEKYGRRLYSLEEKGMDIRPERRA